MIKRTSRNFKVPLVYGGQWKDHQTFQKWDPISKRLITVNCCSPQKCSSPEPVTNVTLTSMVSGSGVVSWTYTGSETQFEVNIYSGLSENVDTSGTPIYSSLSAVSGSRIYFSNISGSYYVASIRVRNNCLFSDYAYSSSVQYLFTGYRYVYALNSMLAGRVSIVPTTYPLVNVNINKSDVSSNDLDSWLAGTVNSATYIKIEKDLSNYVIVTRNSGIDMGSYWQFDSTVFATSGTVSLGNLVNITAT